MFIIADHRGWVRIRWFFIAKNYQPSDANGVAHFCPSN